MTTIKKYEIILADFPWPYTDCGTAKLPYGQMSEQEISSFDWSAWMAKRCVIFAWITAPKMDLQFRCIEQWCANHGLVYQGQPYTWIKTKKDGETPIGAAGPRPRLVKPVIEHVVALSNVKRGRPFPLLTESQKQLVFAPKASRGEHSKKPTEVHRRIVELLGDRPRVELFARRPELGWDVWGNQAPNSVLNMPSNLGKENAGQPAEAALG